VTEIRENHQMLDVYQEEVSAGYRLDSFEAYNWGTFHERVGRARLDGQTTLLTGENGAGKSTLADGIVTLLVPTTKRNYNAASSDAKRERSETDYIRGNTGKAFNQQTERDESVYLRPDGQYYTVLLAVFKNRRERKDVTLAQILWIKSNGETAKVFIVETRALNIEGDLAGFASTGEIKEELKKRGFDPMDKFGTYSERFHRLMKLNPDRLPMDIFNQTVAVKDIKNLTEFIRDYMLEGGSAENLFDGLRERVRELRNTHSKIKMLKDQLGKLMAVSGHVSAFRLASEQRKLLESQREALDAFFARTALRLREALSIQNTEMIALLIGKSNDLSRQKETTSAALEALKARQKNSAQGAQIASLESEIETLTKSLELVEKNKRRFTQWLEVLNPNRQVDSASAFDNFTLQLPAQVKFLKEQTADIEAKEKAAEKRLTELRDEFERTEKEITSLINQHTAIDPDALDRRNRMADSLGISRKNLPFIGELLRVHKNEARWTGAIEKLLRGFALTVLVHHDNYREVDAFVAANNMRGRIEYEPVPVEVSSSGTKPSTDVVAGKVEIKPDAGNFGRYIQRDLYRRFNHRCCESTDQRWHSVEEALTISGLFKGRTGRRVKDDRGDINDRRKWILGWDNHDKLAALKASQKEVEAQGAKAIKDHQVARNNREIHRDRVSAADNIVQASFTFEQIDPVEIQTTIAAKAASRDALKKDPALAKLSNDITIASKDLKEKTKLHEAAVRQLVIAENDEEKNLVELERLRRLTEAQNPSLEPIFALISLRTLEPINDIESLDGRKSSLFRMYSEEVAAQQTTADTSAQSALMKMAEIINHADWMHLHDELGSTAPTQLTDQVIKRFQEVEGRINSDDIPKNEEKFKRLLQENVISDFNTFRTSLNDMEQGIVDRISTINGHLAKVDFDRREGAKTYIRLIPDKTRDQIVRDFRVQLNTALKDILNIDEDIEARANVFHQVNALIESLDQDARRRAHIIDVRNWFDFKAEERYRDSDKSKETYQGAIGKSGGEKSRLASTILATAIAYQYDIEIDRPEGDTFRFVLIDEALSRIGDEFSAYLFEIFARFHLQLLIIHPRDAKLHITERFVRRYNVALKPGRFSSVVNMTVHEFQEYKNRFAIA
jgi:uncharacterized protein YPO0396